MANEKPEKEHNSSIGKSLRNAVLATAIWLTFLLWPTSCSADSWKWKDKSTEKKEVVAETSNDTQINSAVFQQDEKNLPGLEPDVDSQWRTIVNTEIYEDESLWTNIIKKTYEDGSWSEEWKLGHTYEYTEYYPNSNTEKFHIYKDGHYIGAWYHNEWEGRGDYTIYDEQWKILYTEWWGGPEGLDWVDEFDKYDEKGRLIYHEYSEKYTNIFDDENGTVSCITEPFEGSYKLISVYTQTEDGRINVNNETSRKFIGESGIEIDLKNWWIEQLIRDRHLENIPHIDMYGTF